MSFATFKSAPKALIESSQIGPGQIEMGHLAPSLFSTLRQLDLHTHSGVKSRQIEFKDLTGAIGKNGFIMYADDASKKFRVRVNNAGTLYTTEV